MAAISRTTFSNAFSWINISLNFFPKGPIDNIPALVRIMAWRRKRRQAIIWTNGGLVYWHIYASLSLNDLNTLRSRQICLHFPDHIFKCIFLNEKIDIFSCDQAALWMVQSVRPSVRPSVCLSHLFDYVPIIVSSWNFQELLPVTEVTSNQKVKVRGQRSRSQRSQPNLAVSGL